MEIIGKKIKLRPFKESDADNVINWILVETVWQNWDAPREESSAFVQDTYREKCLRELDRSMASVYWLRSAKSYQGSVYINLVKKLSCTDIDGENWLRTNQCL